MRLITTIIGTCSLVFSLNISANGSFSSLANDCFNEWKMRGWTIGEDQKLAYTHPQFAAGIKKICAVRQAMYAEDEQVSPYIQGNLAELAPYVFGGDEDAIRGLIRKLQERPVGPRYSGIYMTD